MIKTIDDLKPTYISRKDLPLEIAIKTYWGEEAWTELDNPFVTNLNGTGELQEVIYPIYNDEIFECEILGSVKDYYANEQLVERIIEIA